MPGHRAPELFAARTLALRSPLPEQPGPDDAADAGNFVSVVIGALFAGVVNLGGTAMTGALKLAMAMGLATMAGIMLAGSGGKAIPIALKSIRIDPALATGLFITTLNDILGILVYLGIA